MKVVKLIGEVREGKGKSAAKKLRDAGLVPCNLYGGNEQVHFSAYLADFKNLVYTPNTHLVDLQLGSKNVTAVLQEVQFHPVSDAIIHVDFLEVLPNKPVIIDVPVKITGNSAGVRAGGKLNLRMRKVSIKGLASNLPDFVEVNIEPLEIGQSVRVRDLKTTGFEILNDAANTVVSVDITRAAKAEEKAAAAAATGKKEEKKK